MDEDGLVDSRKDQIGRSGKVAAVQAKAIPKPMRELANNKLGL
jgi:hypothetical protein